MIVLLPPETKAAIHRLRDIAVTASLAEVRSGQFVGEVIEIIADDMTWIVGYGIEQQYTGPCRHLSISHPSRHLLPDSWVTKALIEEFGFDDSNQNELDVRIEFYRRRGMTAHIMQLVRLIGS